MTMPLVYARLVNVCDERCPQCSTVQVNVSDNLGSSGFSKASFSPEGGGKDPLRVGAEVEKLYWEDGRGTSRCCSEELAWRGKRGEKYTERTGINKRDCELIN